MCSRSAGSRRAARPASTPRTATTTRAPTRATISSQQPQVVQSSALSYRWLSEKAVGACVPPPFHLACAGLFDFEDAVFHLAVERFHRHDFADSLADEGGADGRRGGDLAVAG